MAETTWIMKLHAEGELKDSAGNLLDKDGNKIENQDDSNESEGEQK